jgi:hypothetical protein
MATYHQELLHAARRLIGRGNGQRGKLPNAKIRRSISTSYYALYHFLLEEGATRLVGSHNDFLRRRRMLFRSFSHKGVKAALDKVKGKNVDPAVADFFRQAGSGVGPVASPLFAQNLSKAFSDAQAKRHDADYDLNEPLSEADARLLVARVRRVIHEWDSAKSAADKDFKHALCLLMLLKGQLRQS